jgi:hypothetical protein
MGVCVRLDRVNSNTIEVWGVRSIAGDSGIGPMVWAVRGDGGTSGVGSRVGQLSMTQKVVESGEHI